MASAIRSSGISRAKPSIIRIDVLAARDDQVQVALLQVVVRGEGDELAADVAQPHRADRALERQAAKGHSGGRGPDHRQHVAVVLPVAGHHEGLHLHLVVEPVGEQRADGPVDQPRRQRFLHRRAALPLEEPAGELPRRRHPLAIVARQGKEVDPGPRTARRPQQPARPFRRTAPGNCRRLVWPALRFRAKESPLRSVSQHVLSMLRTYLHCELQTRRGGGEGCRNAPRPAGLHARGQARPIFWPRRIA